MSTYNTDNLPTGAVWRTFRKTSLTNATRIAGPFSVQTSEGVLTCKDGWLAIDARGFPYPIAHEEFRLIYEPFDGAGG